MNENDDLIRMYEAQRKLDEGLTPSFTTVATKSRLAPNSAVANSRRWAALSAIRVAASVIAASAAIAIVVWINSPRQEELRTSSASQNDLSKLNQVCDSILDRLQESAVETATIADGMNQDMQWHSGTDLLMPFETLSFHRRTLP